MSVDKLNNPAQQALEIEQYKEQMLQYFTECSIRLNKWYTEGGANTQEYSIEYKKYVDELEKYNTFLVRIENPTSICQQAPAQSMSDEIDVVRSYSNYYKEMMSYFNKLIESLPEETNDESRHDDCIINAFSSNLSAYKKNSPNTQSNYSTNSNNLDISVKNSERSEFKMPDFQFNIENKSSQVIETENCVYCTECEVGFESDKKFMHHLRGMKHMENVIKKSSNLIYEENTPATSAPLERVSDFANKTFCEVCQVECGSSLYYQFHLNGEKHRAKLGESVVPGRRSRILPRLEVCEEPIIGSRYLIEYQLSECANQQFYTVYLCELCNVACKKGDKIIRHLNGNLHRKAYLKENFPELSLIIERDYSSKSMKQKRLDTYARLIVAEESEIKLSPKEIRIFPTANDLLNDEQLKNSIMLDDKPKTHCQEFSSDETPLAWIDPRDRGLSDDELVQNHVPAIELARLQDSTVKEFIDSIETCGALNLTGYEKPFQIEDMFQEEFIWALERSRFMERRPQKQHSAEGIGEALTSFLNELSAKFAQQGDSNAVDDGRSSIQLPELLLNPMQTVQDLCQKAIVNAANEQPEEGEVSSEEEELQKPPPMPQQIFDAYSVFGNQGKSVKATPGAVRSVFKSSKKTHSKKLSKMEAYAEMLGLNEPQDEMPKPSQRKSSHSNNETAYMTLVSMGKQDHLRRLAQSMQSFNSIFQSKLLHKLSPTPDAQSPCPSIQSPITAQYQAYMCNNILSSNLNTQQTAILLSGNIASQTGSSDNS